MPKFNPRQSLETALVVTLITLLVWLYAEGRNVTEYVNQPVSVQFVAGNAEGLTIVPDQIQRVLVTFEGSNAMKQMMEERLKTGAIQLTVPETADTTLPRPMVMKDMLNSSWLAELGIAIMHTDPAVIPVTVRRVVSVPMPVQVSVTGVELVGQPSVEPSTVNVRMSSSLAELAKTLSLRVRLGEADFVGVPAGVPRVITGRLELPDALQGQEVEFPSRNVAVSVVVRKQTQSVTLPSVPIHLNVPPLVLDRYRILLPEDQLVLRDVTLSGLTDGIESIQSKRFKVWAEIRPTADELDAGVTQFQLYLHIPEGVRVDSAIPRITVDVQRNP